MKKQNETRRRVLQFVGAGLTAGTIAVTSSRASISKSNLNSDEPDLILKNNLDVRARLHIQFYPMEDDGNIANSPDITISQRLGDLESDEYRKRFRLGLDQGRYEVVSNGTRLDSNGISTTDRTNLHVLSNGIPSYLTILARWNPGRGLEILQVEK